jgi:SAM-dependent methyltransferase
VSSAKGPWGLMQSLERISPRAADAARVIRGAPTARRSALSRERFERQLRPARLAVEAGTVTEVLYGRLSEQEVAAAEQRIRDEPGAWEHYFGAAARIENHDVLLALAVSFGCEAVIERTRLPRAQPPEDVHSMARGALNGAGGLYEANLVIDALLSAGGEIAEVRTALDFGCSSGRVLRPLAAAFPDVAWHGCDPNLPAIEWAAANLAGIEFFGSGPLPPLPLEDGSMDLVYAVSIWSHFSPRRGLEWFEEMRRLLRPGGHLVMTTHGPTAIAYYATHGLRPPEQSAEIDLALYRRGWWYAAEFGDDGDWGVVDSDWGTAFLSPEWLLTQLCPHWRVVEYAPGRNQENQDLYVLQRV